MCHSDCPPPSTVAVLHESGYWWESYPTENSVFALYTSMSAHEIISLGMFGLLVINSPSMVMKVVSCHFCRWYLYLNILLYCSYPQLPLCPLHLLLCLSPLLQVSTIGSKVYRTQTGDLNHSRLHPRVNSRIKV